jgi:hypothetical protein
LLFICIIQIEIRQQDHEGRPNWAALVIIVHRPRTKKPGRNHAAGFKAKVALDAIQGEQTLVELSERLKAHPNQIADWKNSILSLQTLKC